MKKSKIIKAITVTSLSATVFFYSSKLSVVSAQQNESNIVTGQVKNNDKEIGSVNNTKQDNALEEVKSDDAQTKSTEVQEEVNSNNEIIDSDDNLDFIESNSEVISEQPIDKFESIEIEVSSEDIEVETDEERISEQTETTDNEEVANTEALHNDDEQVDPVSIIGGPESSTANAQATTEQESEEKVQRIYGQNRYEGARLISEEGWGEGADTVIVANGEVFSDALSGSALSGMYDAPILLTKNDMLHEETVQAIKNLKAKRVILLGGTLSISTNIEDFLNAQGKEVVRFSGANRYEVAANIAEHVMNESNVKRDVFLVNGEAYADALSIASVSADKMVPVFLTKADQLHPSVEKLMHRVNSFTIVGGELSISKEIENSLRDNGLFKKRFGGRNRYEVNRQVLNYYGIPSDRLLVASGETYTDALPAAALAAKNENGLLLIKDENIKTLKDQVSFAYEDHNKDQFTIIGGPLTLSKITEELLENPETTSNYEFVKSQKNLSNSYKMLDNTSLKVYSKQGPLVYGSNASTYSGSEGKNDVVKIVKEAILTNNERYYAVENNGKMLGWVSDKNLKAVPNNVITNLNYYPQLGPNANVGWGCAGASSAMLLSSNGKRFSASELRKIMANVPKKSASRPGGQDGNIYSGVGFTQVVQPEELVPYLKNNYDNRVFNLTGATTDAIIQEVVSGRPVMYYGFTWSDNDKDVTERRNHVKVIRGYRNGKFDIYDPVYTSINDKAGFFKYSTGNNGKYDKGPVHSITLAQFEEEVNNRGNEKRPDRQFIGIKQ